MSEPRSAAEEHRRTQWSAFEWLGEHELLAEEYWDDGRGARWVLGQKDTFIHKCEIIAGIGGSLIVHGDFDVVRFAHYGDHADAFSRLCWMGFCYDVGYYVAQKASIGSGGKRKVWFWDEDVARHDLDELLKDYEDSLQRESLQGAARHVEHEDRFMEYLYSCEIYDAIGENFGRRLDYHVIISHVALNRTACLLLERHGPGGPPACRARVRDE